MCMLILFLRTILLYGFILFILRMTGKRQISDLQPYDLLITMTIADVAATAVSDTGTPLVYSLVPILGLFLSQQAISALSMRNHAFRRMVCGAPLLLVKEGVLDEQRMREANYTVSDLCDHLREENIFDLSKVQYAILETNGSLSVLQKQAADQSTRLSHMLILDGALCFTALKHLHIPPKALRGLLRHMGIKQVQQVFYFQYMGDGSARFQLKNRYGAKVYTVSKKEGKALCS